MKEDKRLDDLFKKKMENPADQPGYVEGDWDALENMLDKHKNRKGIVIFWLPLLSSVAALLLLFLGWWSFQAKDDGHHNSHKHYAVAVNHNKKTNTGTNGGSIRQPTNHTQTTQQTVNYAANLKPGKNGSAPKAIFTSSAKGTRRTAGPDVHGGKDVAAVTLPANMSETLFVQAPNPVFEPELITDMYITPVDLMKGHTGIVTGSSGNRKSKFKPVTGFQPRYALSVVAAPDLNSVGAFQQKLGTNYGLLFSAGFTKKFTITTGVLYSIKPYATSFQDYHTNFNFPVDPTSVLADCRMLDIPINLGYQLYNKQENKISIGTGLSSYIMLHERYTFNYADPYTIGPASYTVPNSNKYFFGVLNLNATFERRLNSRVGLDVQPYMKIPLTNIGYSQVRLQTTGIAVALHWNLN